MICSNCKKEFKPTNNQRFNLKHHSTTNFTCSPLCKRLRSIEVARTKDKIIKTSAYYTKLNKIKNVCL